MKKDIDNEELFPLAGLSGFYTEESKDVLPSFEDIQNKEVDTVFSDIMEVTDGTRLSDTNKKNPSST